MKSRMTFVSLGLYLMAGCSRAHHDIPDHPPPMPPELYQPFTEDTGVPEDLLSYRPYRLSVGDVLEIIYHVKNIPTPGGYKLKIEDVIRVRFPYQMDFDQECVVQGDGNIRCLLVGDVEAAGLTARDIEEKLKVSYAAYIRDPELTVTTQAANVKIAELKKAITTAPRGQSRLVPVKPDGTIDLPYIGQIMVAGRTINDAKKILDHLYVQNDLEEVEVTVQMLELAPKRVYVMGEVPSPGVVETRQPITLTQAIISAGGPNVRADSSHIMVIRREHLPLPQAVIVNLDDMLAAWKASPEGRMPNGSRFRYDMYLASGDIVYLPPTGLAKATDWIDQVFTRGIRSVLPYSANVGMNFGYEIRSAPTTVKTRQIGPPNINAQFGP